jgi:ABC-2 type transport system ATP-binding protein
MIKARTLTKNFGAIKAVDSVSFDVKRGEVLGFLGPNGAGKTTTMRLLAGFFEPNGGEVLIDGIDMLSNPRTAKSRIGYLPENAPVYGDMNVCGFLNFIAGIRGLGRKEASKAIDRAVAVCHLEKVFYQSIDTLSKGYIRRTSFAQAILHDPPALILDEPTDGLDPNQKFEVRNMIKEMGKSKAIIISTHILEEVDACCSRALIISDGKIVANGAPEELRARSSFANTVVISLKTSAPQEIISAISSLENVEEAREFKGKDAEISSFRIYPKRNISAPALALDLAAAAREKNWEVREFRTDDGRLDDVFRKITGNSEEK